jgi:CNT family concentrative nucleoside transporter
MSDAITPDRPPPEPRSESIQPAPLPPMPWSWRAGILAGVVVLTAAVMLLQTRLPAQVRCLVGIVCFLGIVAAFSANLRAVNLHTLGWGIVLQVSLALFVLKVQIGDFRPGFELFSLIGQGVSKFLDFTDAGSKFVFGPLAQPEKVGFVFAFKALPTIVFVASFFTVLYYFGVLQLVVRLMARVMSYFMRTSGAETLSVSANVFMGQTEAPLIIKPYVARMTTSELLAMMVGGMAHISGGLMAVYIGMGADPVAILTTSVMAAPCSLYLAKLLIPETEKPETLGEIRTTQEMPYRNVIDAASDGASEGMKLAINVAAMLIAFLAFIAMFDAILQACYGPTLAQLLGRIFAPAAVLLGVEPTDVPLMGNLLGTKLIANEFVAYTQFQECYAALSPRARILAAYALTGFANIASIGVQIGGIGALAPSRRPDLARLGPYALLAGFLATLINAALAGVLID